MTRHLDDKPAWTRPLLVILSLVILATIIAVAAWPMYRAYNRRVFRTELEDIKGVVRKWRIPPADADPVQWEALWATDYNAIGNAFFTQSSVTQRELRQLREDVEQRDKSPLSIDTLHWLWNRLAQTNPHAREYIAHMQPMWDEALEARSNVP